MIVIVVSKIDFIDTKDGLFLIQSFWTSLTDNFVENSSENIMLCIIVFNNFSYRFERSDVGVDKSIAGRIILVNENIGQIANPIKLKI